MATWQLPLALATWQIAMGVGGAILLIVALIIKKRQ